MNAEPQTIQEMHARFTAARGRMEAAGHAKQHEIARQRLLQRNDDRRRRADRLSERLAAARKPTPQDRALLSGRPPSVQRIIVSVAVEYGFSVADLLGFGRSAPLTRARWEAFKRLRTERSDLSMARIGQLMNCDHTTVRHALIKMGLPTA